ncbi:hypothetical protein B0H10DRAFT_197978 [Mycena sp. CBHHK59/15]|nr:hypothetical protein B0H10DRAFT_197978 [Mycena sp. CBHHK59/15]
MKIKGPQRDLDLSSFARSEGWYTFIEETGLTPAEVQQVIRGSTEDDDDLHDVKDYVVQYLADVQPMIKQHSAFGFQHLMANVGLNQHCLAAFTILTEESQKKYALTLWCLIFALLRQHRGDLDVYTFPLNTLQEECLKALDDSIPAGSNEQVIANNVHLLIHALFSHKKENNCMGKFFSAINCYAALISFLPDDPDLRPASTITSKMMQLIYANCTTQMTHMQCLMDLDEDLLVYDAYLQVQDYLRGMQETPMSFQFNTYSILKIISADEYTDDHAQFRDDSCRELEWNGNPIRLSDFRLPICAVHLGTQMH